MMNKVLSKAAILGFTLAALAGCNENQDAQKVGETANVVKELTQSSGAGSQNSSGAAANNWLTVQAKEYGDSGVVVRLQAGVEGSAAESVLWQQTSGPAVPVINANQLNAEVLLPQVTTPTPMTFQIVATRGGQSLTATQTIVALPLPEQATITTPVLSTQNQSVTLTLNDPVAAATVLPVTILGGTAVAGIDYIATSSTVTTTDGQTVTVPFEILPAGRTQDVYTKIGITLPTGNVVTFTAIIPATVSTEVTQAASSALAISSEASASSSGTIVPPPPPPASSSSNGGFNQPSSVVPPSSNAVAVSSVGGVSSSEINVSSEVASSQISSSVVSSAQSSASEVTSSSEIPSDSSVAESSSSVATLEDDIDFSKFTDPALRECVEATGKVKVSELISLSCSFKGVEDAAGLEQLLELERLSFWNNNLTSIDLSPLVNLTHLDLQGNHLESLDLASNIGLLSLQLSSNNLMSLDLSANVSLKDLWLNSNVIAELDLSKNVELTYLSLDAFGASDIDLSANVQLVDLFLRNNNLTNIDLSNNTKLELLAIDKNSLTNLDVDANASLSYLSAANNLLQSINLSENVGLVELNLSSNQLATIDMSRNLVIGFLDVSGNDLVAIDVSLNPVLEVLDVGINNLKAVDVGSNPALKVLDVSFNDLVTIDVSSNPALERLEIEYNSIPCAEIPDDVIAKFRLTPGPDCLHTVVPDVFIFNNQVDAQLNTLAVSNAIVVTGITSRAVPISISGGEYSLDGGESFTSEVGTVAPNDEVIVRVLSSSSFGETTQAALNIGGVTGTFSVTTMAAVSSSESVISSSSLVGSSSEAVSSSVASSIIAESSSSELASSSSAVSSSSLPIVAPLEWDASDIEQRVVYAAVPDAQIGLVNAVTVLLNGTAIKTVLIQGELGVEGFGIDIRQLLDGVNKLEIDFLLSSGEQLSQQHYLFYEQDTEIKTHSIGIIHFPVSVVAYQPGSGVAAPHDDPLSALGAPNHGIVKTLALGNRGVLILGFAQSVLLSGDFLKDIWIFEVGGQEEPVTVEVSSDGENWALLGNTSGGIEGFNADLPESSLQTIQFVRVTDLGSAITGSPYAGADIDTVGLIESLVTWSDEVSSSSESSSSEVASSSFEASSISSLAPSSSSEISSSISSTSSIISSSVASSSSSQMPLVPINLSVQLQSLDISSAYAEFVLRHGDGAIVDELLITINNETDEVNYADLFAEGGALFADFINRNSINTVTFDASNDFDQAESVTARFFLGSAEEDQFIADAELNVFVGYQGKDTFVGNNQTNIYYYDQRHDQITIDADAAAQANILRLGASFSGQSLSFYRLGNDLIIEGETAGAKITLLNWFDIVIAPVFDIRLYSGEPLTIVDEDVITMPTPPLLFLALTPEAVSVDSAGNVVLSLSVEHGDRPIVSLTETHNNESVDILALLDEGLYQLVFNPTEITGTNIYTFTATDDFGQQVTVSAELTRGTDEADSLTAQAEQAAIFGDDGDDQIIGAAGGSVIAGGLGNDTLTGANGVDTFVIGLDEGVDTIYADRAEDILFLQGITPRQVFVKQAITDVAQSLILLITNDGQVTVEVELVNQLAVASEDGVSQVVFADGNIWAAEELLLQSLLGSPLDDEIVGFDTDDVIMGQVGNDLLSGGLGNDQITGGQGDDLLNGGAGTNTYFYHLGDGNDVIQGDRTADTLVLVDIPSEQVTAQLESANGLNHVELLIAGEVGSLITLEQQLNLNSGVVAGVASVRFSDDVVWTVVDLLSLAGDCQGIVRTLMASADGELLEGGDFDEGLNGGSGDDNLAGNGGCDLLNGEAGNDTLLGGDGDDDLDGGQGDDVLDGGPGNDAIFGNLGNDRIIFGNGSGADTVAQWDGQAAGTFNDTLVFGEGITLETISLEKIGNDLILQLIDSNDSVTFVDWFLGAPYQMDTFEFADGTVMTRAEFMSALPVKSDVAGTDGDDVLVGYEGIDQMRGFAGDDSLSGRTGNDELRGDEGNDILQGEAGNDTLLGGDGDDDLDGGQGDDVLDGGPGNDAIFGNLGNDRIIFGNDSGADTVAQWDGQAAGTFNDTLVFGEGITLETISLEKIGNDLILQLIDSTDSVTFVDWFLGAPYQMDTFEFAVGTVMTRAEFLAAATLYEDKPSTWSYLIIDDVETPNYSSPETDIADWLTSVGPFANDRAHPLAGNFDFPLEAEVDWPSNSYLWLHSDVTVPESSQLKLRIFADNYASLWVNGRQYLHRVGGLLAGDLVPHEVIISARDLQVGSNRVVILAEDAGSLTYAHAQVSVITPSAAEQARQERLTKACSGEMPTGIEYAEPVVNPYEKAEFYLDPDYAERIKSTQDQLDDVALVAAMEMVKDQSTGIWLDSTQKLCGEPKDRRMNLLQHLENAQRTVVDEPVVVSTVVFNLPARDCVSGNHPGEFEATEEGLAGYRQYIDTIAALAANYPDLRIVAAIEPGALASSVERDQPTVPFSYCEYAFADSTYEKGVVYALQKFAEVPNVYSYLDVGHAAWLGWRIDALTRKVSSWLAIASELPSLDIPEEGNAQLIAGLVTNVSEYIPYEEPYIQNFDETSPNFSFYSWNAHATAKSYANAIQKSLLEATGISYGVIIDSSRNGWGGDRRPTMTGTDESYRIDQRSARWHWCNHSRAGLGRFPEATPDADNTNIHAFYWFKPPGESDGNDEPVREGIFQQYEIPVASCTDDFRGGAPSPTAASAWFEQHFIQLIENAWPPLIEPAKTVEIDIDPRVLPIASADDLLVSFELPVAIAAVQLYGKWDDTLTFDPITWDGGFFETPLNNPLFNRTGQARAILAIDDVNGEHYTGEFLLDTAAPFVMSEGVDVAIYSRRSQSALNTMSGAAGNDILIDLLHQLTVDGGAGNDVVQGAQLYGGEGNDLLILTGVEVDQFASGGAGDDDYYVYGTYSNIRISDLEGSNRIFMPLPENGAVDEFYRDETDLYIYRMNANGGEEVIVTVEGFFATAQTFDGVFYTTGKLILTPDDQVPLLPADDAQSVALGRAEFDQQCAVCHVGGNAPNLIFTDLSGDELIAKIDQSMPQRSPLSCVGDCAINVALFIEQELKPQAQSQF